MDRMQTDGSKEGPKPPAPCGLWPVDLKLTHIDCNPDDTLVHFQGQHVSICELDYNILQVEIQNTPKSTGGLLEVGDFCLVEDVLSGRWFRGRIQNKSRDGTEVFLLDHGNVLTVGPDRLSQTSNGLLVLPPKIVCGFVANVLPVQERWDAAAEEYFSSLIGSHVKGHVHGLLPHKVLILEVPGINKELLRLNLCRHVDTETFLVLVEMLVEIPVQQNSQPIPDLLLEEQIVQELSFKSSHSCGFENVLLLSRARLEIGQKAAVCVTAAADAGLFYCQLSSVEKDLKAMSEELALACESRMSGVGNNPGENIGLLCAIKGKDLRWHRGVVQCLPVNSHVRVLFVDHGYFESVNVENVHRLPSDFLLMPVGTFPCSLTCLTYLVKDAGELGDAKKQQMFFLRQGLLGKELKITVDGLDKEKNVYSVTLSGVVRDTVMDPAQKVLNCDGLTSQQSSKCANESQTVETLRDSGSLEDLVDGSVFEGYVEHIQSPNDFWMRTVGRNARFEDMMNSLTDYFGRLQLHEQILEDPVPGVLCCAMYEKDLHYYRALVLDTLENGAEVFFIDFGNTEKVPSLLIKKLPEEFASEPEFALRCSLAHVAPVNDVWTVTSTDFFRRATQNKVIRAHVVHRRNSALVVELFEEGKEGRRSIAELMSRENLAEYWECSPTTISRNTTNETFRIKPSAQNLAAGRERLVDKPAPGMNPNPTAVDVFKPQKIQPGSELTVQCTYVSSPSNFWCQNIKRKVDVEELNERLQAFYRTNMPVLPPHSVCCAVKVRQYDRWYRGCITGRQNSDVVVTLVDYGLVLQEKLSNLRALMPEFLSLETQAFPCSLYNLIEPIGGSVWPEEASTLLKDFVSIRPLSLTCRVYSQLSVVNKGLCNVVDLYTPVQRATAYLVGKGVALEIRSPKELVPLACPCSFVYSSFNVSPGDTELVYCTHVVSPWEIYVQLDRNTEIVEKLMERTMKESEGLLKRRDAAQTQNVCLVKYFGDGLWYRSLVRPARSSRHFNAFFVDFGNKQVTEIENVLHIPRDAVDLLFTPMQALRCSLEGAPEDEHLSEVNSWLEEAVLNKALRANFVSADESGRFVCKLFDGEVNVGEKVKELLGVHSQKRTESKEVTAVTSNLVKCKTPPRRRCLLNHTLIKSTPRTKQPCQKNSPKASVQGKNRDGTKVMGQIRKVLKKKDTVLASFQEPSVVIPKLSNLPGTKLVPGFKYVGFISHSGSSDNFFIQVENDEPKILKMVEELNCSAFSGSMKPITSEVKVGDLVAAVYEEDRSLYRALVTDVASSGILTVEFIDYGNTATIDKQKIFHLASKFLTESRLSIQCTLWKPCNYKDVQSFTKEAQNKPLLIEFVQNLGVAWEVRVELLVPLLEARTDGNINVPASNQAKLSPNKLGIHNSVSENSEVEKPNLKEAKEQPNKFVMATNDKAVQWRVPGQKRRRVRPRRPNNIKRNQEQGTPKPGSRSSDQLLKRVPKNSRTQSKVVVNNMHDGDTLNQSDDVQRLSNAPLQTNLVCCGVAAALTTPDEFHIVLEDSLLTLSAVSNILEFLPEELPSLPESHLIPGAGCLLKPGDKNNWRRAEIIKRDDTSFLLNLVDYGHCERLPYRSAHRLKELPRELAALPRLTYACVLRGIEPAGGPRWSDDAVTFFQERMYKKNLRIVFRQQVSEVKWEVDVFSGYENVAKALCDAGHASYLDAVLGIRFQQSLHQVVLTDEVPKRRPSEMSEDALTRSCKEPTPDCRFETEMVDQHQSGDGACHDFPSRLRKCRLM